MGQHQTFVHRPKRTLGSADERTATTVNVGPFDMESGRGEDVAPSGLPPRVAGLKAPG